MSFEDHVTSALTATWSAAVPTIAALVLWSRGDVAPVYALARARSPGERPGLLAWLAAIDPEPDSARVALATRDALREGRGEALLPVLALAPLTDPANLALARRVADPRGRAALSLRHGGEPLAEPSGPILAALSAVRLAELGRRSEAEETLDAGLRELFADDAAGRALIPAIRRLDAWDRCAQLGHSSATLWAAFIAGQISVHAAERFRESSKDPWCLGAAALGAGAAPEAWRPHLAARDEALLAEWFAEGLVSVEEGWTLRFGAAIGADDAAQRDALLLRALAAAHESARARADAIAARTSAPARDEQAILAGTARMDATFASLADAKIEHGTLRRALRPARKLAAAGGAAEVRRALAVLERGWGPAQRWPEQRGWRSAGLVALTAELLACAAGRASEALALGGGELGGGELAASVRVQICSGLARDGELDALEAPLTRLLGEGLEPAEVVDLTPAIVAREPAAATAIAAAAARALAALPADDAAARAWLDACDRASLRSDARRRGRAARV